MEIVIEGIVFEYREYKRLKQNNSVIEDYIKNNKKGKNYMVKLSNRNQYSVGNDIGMIADFTLINPIRQYTVNLNQLMTIDSFGKAYNQRDQFEIIVYEMIVRYERDKKINTLLDE